MSAEINNIGTRNKCDQESFDTCINSNQPEYWFRRKVWRRVASTVPESSYTETTQPFPLQRDTSKKTIARCVSRYNDGEYDLTDGVYVLECFNNPVSAGLALKNQVSYNSLRRYYELGNPRRILYVGVSENVPRRIHQHLNHPGTKGAYFTAIYRPVRLLQIGWFRNYRTAERAERLTAKFLKMRFPNDYIAQPG